MAAALSQNHPQIYLQKFKLYETRSQFYMIGRDKSRTVWRVLKIDRTDPSELNITEDATVYSQKECADLLNRIHEGNKSTGGLRFVTSCYGIAGFVKFLGPYYMLLITKRRAIGAICGHLVYAVTKSEMFLVPNNSSILSSMLDFKAENRYKKLLRSVDLTKDFFFSYSYHIMRSLQNNLSHYESGQVLYETLFVWNEFLTRGIRNHLKNTMWTVALIHGFFKQAKLSISGKDFRLTLIARRSRHYAGTRYLKRGVNENGRVANDVETEQIVFEDIPGEIPTQITSVVQYRGSIPLFWSQETSRLNIRPDIILHKDKNYEATRLHFENLGKRYGNPIIILNLIKSREKKPRESILRAEFANAIDFLNKNLLEDNRLKFLHWDLNKYSQSNTTNVLWSLGKIATYALNLTGFFYCQVTPAVSLEGGLKWPVLQNYTDNDHSCNQNQASGIDDVEVGVNGSQNGYSTNSDTSRQETSEANIENAENSLIKQPLFQRGVLRTNCIDCLDRTNVAQYTYGLAALGHQLHVLGFIDIPKIDLDATLADELMSFYERMGDTLALQYGGSAAHNKIFSERRGQWKAATQSQEFFRTLQRYYSNAYMDAEKQDAINLFLGHFVPQQGKPAIWDLNTDQQYNFGRHGRGFADEDERSYMKRSISDGNILRESNSPVSLSTVGQKKHSDSTVSVRTHETGKAMGLSESTHEISTCETDVSYSRYTPMIPRQELFAESAHICLNDHGIDSSNCSNFLDLDWLSSSGNSCEEEIYERSTLVSSPVENLSTENVINGLTNEISPPLNEGGSSIKGKEVAEIRSSQGSDVLTEFPDSFVKWVIHGEALFG